MNTYQKILQLSAFIFVMFTCASTIHAQSISSSDGRYVVFSSNSTTLVSGDTNGKQDVFLRDVQLGTTTMISVNSDEQAANNHSSEPKISANGRYIIFESSSTNLVTGDTNGKQDVFLRDVQLGTTTRISVSSDGTQGDDESYYSYISADGRYVVFNSYATNLVADDTNDSADTFLRDTKFGTTTLISVSSGGTQGDDESSDVVAVSDDGRYVVFSSYATNLVPGDINHSADAFLRDTQLGTTTMISVNSDEVQGNDFSLVGNISADGRYVVFISESTNLVPSDTNGAAADVFLRDTQLGTTTMISVSSDEVQGNQYSSYYPSLPQLSSNGRYIVFVSRSDNLVAGDTNVRDDVFLRDLQLGTTTRISVNSDEVQGNNNSDQSGTALDNGRYVVFSSYATNLVPGDTNGTVDVFVRDTQLGTTTLISRPSNPSIQYAGNFAESTANDGTLTGSRIATLTGDDFVNAGATFTLSTQYTLTNAPTGLVPVMTISGDGATATLTFTGAATAHVNANDVSNLTITFLDGAFVTTSSASEVMNSTNAGGVIDFADAEVVVQETPRTRVIGGGGGGSSVVRPVVIVPTPSTDTTDCRQGDNFSSTTGAKCSGSVTTPPTPTTPTTSTPSFTKSLKQGMTDPEVKLLQQYLNSKGFTIAPTGPGSKGMETSFFGPATKAAVIKFQLANNITPAVGFFGPLTRGSVK